MVGTFNPSRLSLAKRRRRLTGKALAELTGLTPVTISRLETAHNEPEPETVDALAKALGFPRAFFFGDDIDGFEPDAASFRSLTAMSAKEREAAFAAGALAVLLADWVSERFNLPTPDLVDLSQERCPEAAARILRQHWALGEQPVGNLIKLLEAKGIRVFSLYEDTKNVDAFSCWRNDVPFVFLNTFKSSEHSRFDAAHELGHLVLHKHGGPQQGRDAEQEANRFASSFLMPSADVLAKIPRLPPIEQLIKAKKRWRVSLAALGYRLHKLGVMTDWQYRTFCIQLNKRGYRTNEPEPIEREESVIWRKVFSDLWSDKVTKAEVADALLLPLEELENLVFGLVGPLASPMDMRDVRGRKPILRVIEN